MSIHETAHDTRARAAARDEYNGWENRATWLAGLWLSNDHEVYLAVNRSLGVDDPAESELPLYQVANHLASAIRPASTRRSISNVFPPRPSNRLLPVYFLSSSALLLASASRTLCTQPLRSPLASWTRAMSAYRPARNAFGVIRATSSNAAWTHREHPPGRPWASSYSARTM